MAEKADDRNVQPCYQYESLEFTVTPELNQQYLYAEEDFHTGYIEGQGESPAIVHPALILNMSNHSRSPSYSLPPGTAGLHSQDEVFFCHPARVGKKLIVTWKIQNMYEKRGRTYKVVECHVTDEDNVEILKRLGHITVISRQTQQAAGKE